LELGAATRLRRQTRQGRVPAPANGVWGLFDERGKTAIKPRFESVLPFSEGLAAAKHEGRWGFINKSGAEVIPFQYRLVQSFHGGVAIVDTGLPDIPSRH